MKRKSIISPPRVCHSVHVYVTYVSLFAALLVALISCAHQPIQEGGSITDKIIAAYGGRERIAKVTSVAAEGQISSLMRGEAGIYRRALRRDHRLFINFLSGRSSERWLLDDTRGYRDTDGHVEEVFGHRYHAMVDKYNELNLPFGLLDNTFTVTELGRTALQGTEVRILQLVDRAGNRIDAYVRTGDYLIIKCTGTFENGLQSLNLGSEFSDFRRVEGILFPFRIINSVQGDIINEITIRAYLLNAPMVDAQFKP